MAARYAPSCSFFATLCFSTSSFTPGAFPPYKVPLRIRLIRTTASPRTTVAIGDLEECSLVVGNYRNEIPTKGVVTITIRKTHTNDDSIVYRQTSDYNFSRARENESKIKQLLIDNASIYFQSLKENSVLLSRLAVVFAAPAVLCAIPLESICKSAPLAKLQTEPPGTWSTLTCTIKMGEQTRYFDFSHYPRKDAVYFHQDLVHEEICAPCSISGVQRMPNDAIESKQMSVEIDLRRRFKGDEEEHFMEVWSGKGEFTPPAETKSTWFGLSSVPITESQSTTVEVTSNTIGGIVMKLVFSTLPNRKKEEDESSPVCINSCVIHATSGYLLFCDQTNPLYESSWLQYSDE